MPSGLFTSRRQRRILRLSKRIRRTNCRKPNDSCLVVIQDEGVMQIENKSRVLKSFSVFGVCLVESFEGAVPMVSSQAIQRNALLASFPDSKSFLIRLFPDSKIVLRSISSKKLLFVNELLLPSEKLIDFDLYDPFLQRGLSASKDIGSLVSLVVGDKNTGKTQLSQRIINQFLEEKHKDVFLMDCDLGQPLIGLPGFISLFQIQHQLFLPCPNRVVLKPKIAFFVGETSTTSNVETYLKAVRSGFSHFQLLHSEKASRLVINTQGFVKSIGESIIRELLFITRPQVAYFLPSAKYGLSDFKANFIAKRQCIRLMETPQLDVSFSFFESRSPLDPSKTNLVSIELPPFSLATSEKRAKARDVSISNFLFPKGVMATSPKKNLLLPLDSLNCLFVFYQDDQCIFSLQTPLSQRQKYTVLSGLVQKCVQLSFGQTTERYGLAFCIDGSVEKDGGFIHFVMGEDDPKNSGNEGTKTGLIIRRFVGFNPNVLFLKTPLILNSQENRMGQRRPFEGIKPKGFGGGVLRNKTIAQI